ncbi:MAG: HAMP domain-containing histidine kinase [Hamadaea sp.]|uniref:sensor histidine kinase n=1 Tax=Hamadaea sp. TaxID=2024425 RepID=UPI00183CA0BE|nr:HAMP domain-containing sensor histidine kinase [Hamadaea sp.]NUR71382.1 HAMP domain-containing histidine kinase [Hamadaea sp.]NUT22679.1 HAMP domain-containing histidine kinase [Hamadaea sp.]
MSRRRFRPTLRTRLTLVYGSLFLLAGIVLLGVTFLLVQQQLPGTGNMVQIKMSGSVKGSPAPDTALPDDLADRPYLISGSGQQITASDVPKYLEQQQRKLRTDALTSLLTQGGIALGIVGVAAIALGWLIAGRVLAPLHQVTETARRIANARGADLSLHERIALEGGDDDVKELADTFDTMVERLDRSFEGQRRFVANASHELRTPLTLNRALVEVAMNRKTASADVKQLGETLLEINTRHERLINGLLLLARSENEVLERTEIDLADVVTHVVAQAAEEARAAEVTLAEEPAEAITIGDPILLERLAQNLVENAIRHNHQGGFARVTSRVRPDGGVELEVANSGLTIPPYDIPGLFEPFRRLDDERLVTSKGAGLGLSIVRSVARAHGGEVVARPRSGGGLVVTVTLPAAYA